MLVPTNVEQLRPVIGLEGCHCNFVQNHSIIAPTLTDILRNKCFLSKRSRKLPNEWDEREQKAFQTLEKNSFNSPVLAFPSWTDSFVTHTDARMVEAEAVSTYLIQDKDLVIAFASHHFWKTASLIADEPSANA